MQVVASSLQDLEYWQSLKRQVAAWTCISSRFRSSAGLRADSGRLPGGEMLPPVCSRQAHVYIQKTALLMPHI